jgi:beta-aspartyl-dipeptidase (metallo-type)
VLKLQKKGRLDTGMDADIQVIDKETLQIRHLFAKDKQLAKEGELRVRGRLE